MKTYLSLPFPSPPYPNVNLHRRPNELAGSLIGNVPLGHRHAKVLHDALKVERQQVASGVLQQRQRQLQQRVHRVEEEEVDDDEDGGQGELGGEEGKEPLAGVHVRLDVQVEEVHVQLREVVVEEALQLVKLAVQLLQAAAVEAPEAVVVHDPNEDAEGLLLGHVQEEGGDEEGKALAVANLLVVVRVGLADEEELLLA